MENRQHGPNAERHADAVVAIALGGTVQWIGVDRSKGTGVCRCQGAPMRIVSAAGVLAVDPAALTGEDFHRLGGATDWSKTDAEAVEIARVIVAIRAHQIEAVARALAESPEGVLLGSRVHEIVAAAA